MTSNTPNKIEFETINGTDSYPRLTLLLFGPTKEGKTWTALSAPGPLGIISNDSNTRVSANKWKREHPDTVIEHYKEFFRSPLSEIDDVNDIKRHWSGYRDAYYAMVKNKSIRSIIMD